MDIKNCMPYFASFKDLYKRFGDWFNEYLYFYFYYIKDLEIDIMNIYIFIIKRFEDWYNEILEYLYFYLYYQYWVTISNLFYLLLKYGWDRAYLAVILVSGLLSSITKSRL